MATRFPDDQNCDDIPTTENDSNSSHPSRLISQRQLSDSRTPTTCILLFENAELDSSEIYFLEYCGTRARNHHSQKLYLPQVKNKCQISSDETYTQFSNSIKEILNRISLNELSSYVISIRTGVTYFFSKRFRFKNRYSINEIHELIQKKIPLTDERYYFPQRNHINQLDDSLRSSFSNVKPISKTTEFGEKLESYEFHVKESKHVFRIYLQSEDKQTHVCIVDPALNYSITEFSKDFQRNSNIDFIRNRHSSKFFRTKTYDDVFDFRIQFQYNPRTCYDEMNTIEYELYQQFPSLNKDFKNEFILKPIENNETTFLISKQLYPYIRFIRRDFGDIYQYNGQDELFENFNIYLESSVEYSIDKNQSICTPSLDTHGLVYAKLNLNTMTSLNGIDENLLIHKLWDMGTGLTDIAGECTTSETQQATNYYTSNGEIYTAEDEALIQRILKQRTIWSMLGLSKYANHNQIQQEYNRINNQLDTKWDRVRSGRDARDKLYYFYYEYLGQQK